MAKTKRLIYFDDSIWNELQNIKTDVGIPISRSLEKAASEYLKKRGKV